MIEHTIYHLTTGEILQCGSTVAAWLAENVPEGCSIILGRYDSVRYRVDISLTPHAAVERDYLDEVFISSKKSKIKDMARSVISSRYPQWKQNNIIASGDPAQISSAWAWIDAVRDYSNSLEAQVDAGITVDIEAGWPS